MSTPVAPSSPPASGPLPPSQRPVVVVVGAQRAGLSVVASTLGALGLGPPQVKSPPAAGPGSYMAGRSGSISLTRLSDEVLRRLGGSWDDPPELAELKAESPGPPELLGPLRVARSTFDAALGEGAGSHCWADPRTSLLLPFWRHVFVGIRPVAAVLCVREPLLAARSLDGATGVGLPVALALWERYTRRAVEGVAGLPVFVSVLAGLLGDPARWQAAMEGWLGSLHVPVAVGPADLMAEGRPDPGSPGTGARCEGRAGAADSSLGDGIERGGGAAAGQDNVIVLSSQQRLYDELAALSGGHVSFGYTPSFDESPWTGNVLEQRRDQNRFWRAADWLAKELIDHLPEPPPAEGRQQPDYPPNATTDLPRYHRFLRDRGESIKLAVAAQAPARARRGRRSAVRAASPLFSVVVPVYRASPEMIGCCLSSVLAQDFGDFELCVCDDASGDEGMLGHLSDYAEADSRVSLTTRTSHGGRSAAVDEAARHASGRYIILLGQHDALHRSALRHLADAIGEQPDADVIYSDEDAVDEEGNRHSPRFKPGWSPDFLLSNPYMSHLLAVRRRLFNDLGGLRLAFDGAEDYDLMLRATEATDAVVHVPEVLYHRRSSGGPTSEHLLAEPGAVEAGTAETADAGRRALEEAVVRRGLLATVDRHPSVPGSYHVRRRSQRRPLVSVIIPFRDEPALTAACYRSFIEQPGYENFELLLVDNDSELPETRALLDELVGDHRVRLLEAPGPFDWAAINNRAAKEAHGEVLLFMNNDVEARSPDWLDAMVSHAARPEVGAVGARLLYPDLTVQHAGVAVGIGWGTTHIQQGLPADEPGYMSIAVVTRNCSAVTGACLMARKDVFDEVGGFDANLAIAFNDIDFCLRLRERGLLVVYTPLAELIHHESKSIGHTELVEAPYFRRRWRSLMLAGDPYYNPNLGRFDNSCRLPTEEDEGKWATFLSMLDESSTS